MCLLKYFKKRKQQKAKEAKINSLKNKISNEEFIQEYFSWCEGDPDYEKGKEELEIWKKELKKLNESL